jgi:hypothetical protein
VQRRVEQRRAHTRHIYRVCGPWPGIAGSYLSRHLPGVLLGPGSRPLASQPAPQPFGNALAIF